MLNLKKEVRDLGRFNQIVLILMEERLGFFFDNLRMKFHHKKDNDTKKKILKPEERLRIAFEKLGPTFIKFGQLLSVRPDLVPKEFLVELEKLQDDVPSFQFKDVKKIIEKELKKPLDKIFSEFNERPIASASISQVHKAKLKTGEIVAVKVQRPKVRELMSTDIEIMFFFAKYIEKHFRKLRKFRPVAIVEEFADWTKNELDFISEARNAQIFAQNFKNSETVSIPKIYMDHTTHSVIVMEFLDGIEIHKITESKPKWLDMQKAIHNSFDAILTQVFIHGFFHADPHPGNILVSKDNKICFVDFGIVGYFDKKLRKSSVKIFTGVIYNDADKVVEGLLEICRFDYEPDVDKFKREVARVLLEMTSEKTIEELKVSMIIEEILAIALNHGMKIPKEFVLFGKTIVTLEGIALEYDTKFKFVDEAKPFVEKYLKESASPMNVISDFSENFQKFRNFFTKLPDKIDKTIDILQRGTFKVDIGDAELRRLSLEIDRSSNRLAYGILISALLVTGALMIQYGEPWIYGLPIISVICFSIAIIFSFFLFISIVRERAILRR